MGQPRRQPCTRILSFWVFPALKAVVPRRVIHARSMREPAANSGVSTRSRARANLATNHGKAIPGNAPAQQTTGAEPAWTRNAAGFSSAPVRPLPIFTVEDAKEI